MSPGLSHYPRLGRDTVRNPLPKSRGESRENTRRSDATHLTRLPRQAANGEVHESPFTCDRNERFGSRLELHSDLLFQLAELAGLSFDDGSEHIRLPHRPEPLGRFARDDSGALGYQTAQSLIGIRPGDQEIAGDGVAACGAAANEPEVDPVFGIGESERS